MTTRRFLDQVYAPKTPLEMRGLYDAWAEDYDEELTANGYETPRRVAAALAGALADRAAPVLDFGCGTGLSGAALAQAGFTTVDGCDVSAGMLERARASGLYRALWQSRLDGVDPLDQYRAVTAAGVISSGAASPQTFDAVVDALAPGGLFVLSMNAHALADPAYAGRLRAAIDEGRVRLLSEEEGDHIAGIGLRSTVFVLERRPAAGAG